MSNELIVYRDEQVIASHPVEIEIELTDKYIIIDNKKLNITSNILTFKGTDGYFLSFSCGKYELIVYYTSDKQPYMVQITYKDKTLEFKVNTLSL
jgi:hypothetical protein